MRYDVEIRMVIGDIMEKHGYGGDRKESCADEIAMVVHEMYAESCFGIEVSR